MSATINMKLTTAGRAAIFNAQGTGVQAVLSHVQIGTGRRTPDGSETAMVTPVQTTTIAAGSKPSPTQIRVSCLFPGISNYDMTEIGVWIGNPAAGGVLFAYHSVTTGKIGTMVSGTDFVFAHEWSMDAADAAALTILADTGQSAMLAMMAAHEAASDPHPQYATDAQLAGLVGTASPTMNGVAAAGTATKYSREDHRHPSDNSKANKAGDTFTGNITIDRGANEAAFVAQGGSAPYAALISNTQWWGLWSSAGGQLVHYDRETGKKYFAGIDSAAIVQNNWGSYSINISGNAATASTAENASKLGSAYPAYYTDIPARLGFTPVQQGTGAGQTNGAVKIGWGAGGIRLQVDGTDFGFTWPMNINGNATTATSAGNADTVDGWHADPLRTWGNILNIPPIAYNNGGTYNISIYGNAGTADSAARLAASPGTAPHYAVRAWVNFDGTTTGIRNAGNVSSITDLGVGRYRINFASAMPSASYAVGGSFKAANNDVLSNNMASVSPYNYGVWSVDIVANDAGTARDCVNSNIHIIC